jgi:hypothetical protein
MEISVRDVVCMKFKNPFYTLLLLAAVLFCITACSYCVMILKRSAEATFQEAGEAGGLVGFLDTYGAYALSALVLTLAVFTVAAMATDDYWTRRATPRTTPRSKSEKT